MICNPTAKNEIVAGSKMSAVGNGNKVSLMDALFLCLLQF